MKTRRTKVLLSLLAVIAAGFAVTNAYIFTVENRDPFGVLNLSTLVIKPTTSSESMVLSGYTLKIKTQEGKLKVHRICNELEENEQCIEINNIVGNGGGNGSGITASGTTGDFCKLKEDGNLDCDDSELFAQIALIQAALDEIHTPSDATITIKQGDYSKSFTLNQANNDTIVLPGGNGDTIISGALVTQTGANTGYYCSSTDGETLICNNALTSNGSGITATGTTGRYCKLKDNGDLDCDLDPETIGEGGLMLGNTTSGGYCRYSCMDKNEFNGLDDSNKEGFLGGSQGRTQGDLICVITCTDTNVGGGSDHWTLAKFNTAGPFYLTPNIGNNVMFHQDISSTGAFNFYTYNGTPFITPSQYIKFDGKGIRVGAHGVTLYSGAGLSVGGIIAAGNDNADNFIYMYATGNNSDDLEKHYEIMGSQQLAIGTRAGAFIYFTQRTGEYNSNLDYGAGPANNSYSPGTCGAPKPDGDDSSTIIKDGEEGGTRGECTMSQGHERSSATWNPGNMNETHVYQSLMVGVNTNAPKATLDINGSIRIGGNCFPLYTPCSEENVGTIMYAENDNDGFLVMCMKKGGSYVRYDIINNELQENFIVGFGLGDDNLHCDLPKPTPGNYPSQMGQASANVPLIY